MQLVVGTVIDIYGGKDPREIPAYSAAEAARYLQLPVATVRAWALGRRYPVEEGTRTAPAVIQIAQKKPPILSFQNLVELHILGSLRRKHRVKLREIRKAIAYVRRELGIDRPLLDQQMATDGKDLFVQRFGQLLNVSQDGQMEMKAVVAVYLERIVRDEAGFAKTLFPFTQAVRRDAPRSVSINSRIQFGRPCIAGTGLPTAVIASRYFGGDSIALLADDYGQTPQAIEEAIRCEARPHFAA